MDNATIESFLRNAVDNGGSIRIASIKQVPVMTVCFERGFLTPEYDIHNAYLGHRLTQEGRDWLAEHDCFAYRVMDSLKKKNDS